jgi:hypothetical protein
LRVAANVQPATDTVDVRTRTPEIFHGPNGAEIETDQPIVKSALHHLGSIWPECVAFDELLERVTPSGTAPSPEAAESLATALIRAYAAGFIQLRAHRPPLAAQPGPRPRSSALARLQLRSGNRVTTFLHTIIQIDDALGRALVQSLDGSRDRAMLQAELARLPEAAGQPVTSEAVEAGLRGLAHRALLTDIC